MDRKTHEVILETGGYQKIEHLVNMGRQMHDQAVFDLFARLVSWIAPVVKASRSITVERRNSRAVSVAH